MNPNQPTKTKNNRSRNSERGILLNHPFLLNLSIQNLFRLMSSKNIISLKSP